MERETRSQRSAHTSAPLQAMATVRETSCPGTGNGRCSDTSAVWTGNGENSPPEVASRDRLEPVLGEFVLMVVDQAQQGRDSLPVWPRHDLVLLAVPLDVPHLFEFR